MPKEYKIVLYDGVCLLCNAFVLFIIRNDKQDKFRFKTLQSYELSEERTRLDSVQLIDKEKVYCKSSAAIRILFQLKFWWYPFILLLAIPKGFRDYIYSLVAKNRYKVFGRANECIVPDDTIKYKFLK